MPRNIRINLSVIGGCHPLDVATDEWSNMSIFLHLDGFNNKDLEEVIKHLEDEEAWGKDTFEGVIKEIRKVIDGEPNTKLDDFL